MSEVGRRTVTGETSSVNVPWPAGLKVLVVTLLATVVQTDPVGAQTPSEKSFEHDDRAMAHFEFWIGTWGAHPDSADAEKYREVFEWAIPGKAVRKMEFRPTDRGGWVQMSEALISYHYGLQEVRFVEPVRDGLNPFEVLYAGEYQFQEGAVAPSLIRLNRAYDSDSSSRLYRETYRAIDDVTRILTIEVRRDDGSWGRFGEFRAVRRAPIERGGLEDAFS